MVLNARDDAAAFVASQGQIRRVQLEAAIDTLRHHLPEAHNASDLLLAVADAAARNHLPV